MIYIKVPCFSNIFDKVCFTSNSQSDHVSLMNSSTSDSIMNISKRSIEDSNLLVNSSMPSDYVSQCIVKVRKADSSSTLAFKISSSSLPKFFSTWFTCGHSGKLKTKDQSSEAL